MNDVLVFYEKPGCVTNGKQKDLLRELGHRLVVRDLLAEPWTRERLRSFFGERPVADWFNPTAPSIKNGAVLPSELDEDRALDLMLADPILIRRPLIEAAGRRSCGFDPGSVRDLVGVYLDLLREMQSCSKPGPDAWCEPPGGP